MKNSDQRKTSNQIMRCAVSKNVQMRVCLACVIHEDSAPRVNSAKQVALAPEKRGLPRAEGDRVRCLAIMASGVE